MTDPDMAVSDVRAERLKRIRLSPSLARMDQIAQLKRENREVFNLSMGEPDFAPADHILEATVKAIRNGETRYTQAGGTPALREAVADKFRRENALVYGPGDVLVGTGAKQLIFAAFGATLGHGDEVIVPAPYWVSYPDIARFFAGTPKIVPASQANGFKITADDLERAITPRTRWLVLNSPNNPSGAVYSEDEMRALGAVLERHEKVMVLTDEIYEHFIYHQAASAPSFAAVCPHMHGRTFTINGVSKSYALTGLRIGYAGGPTWLIEACRGIISQDTSCPSSVGQAAALAALTGTQSSLASTREAYRLRRDRLVERINAIPGLDCIPPDGAFYAYPSVSGLLGRTTPAGKRLETDDDVADFFLMHAGVATMAGSAFGLSPYIRLSFATSEDTLKAACEHMDQAVKSTGN